jgi:hypothetical protein
LDANVNGGAPIAGQDYILNISIKNYIAIGGDNNYEKYGCVHATKNMTASDFYKTLAVSLVKNFAREPYPLFKFTLGGITTEIKENTKVADIAGVATGLVIEEVEQKWERGTTPQDRVIYTVNPRTVVEDGEDVIWGVVTPSAGTVYQNSKKVADMEWFFHKEIGDVYGLVGYPRVIDTKYMVDPDNENGYSFIDIHYCYVGSNESVQKSEKTLTIVGDSSKLNKIVTSLDTLLTSEGKQVITSANWNTI